MQKARAWLIKPGTRPDEPVPDRMQSLQIDLFGRPHLREAHRRTSHRFGNGTGVDGDIAVPRLLIPNNICLLPVECSAGTRPIQAAISRARFLALGRRSVRVQLADRQLRMGSASIRPASPHSAYALRQRWKLSPSI
jgi:hypothetical protein